MLERERRESLNVRLRVIVCLCELTKMGRNFWGKMSKQKNGESLGKRQLK
jgi:hypothetical protein